MGGFWVFFPGGQMVKRLPAIQETWVRSLGWEDPLEKEMATHSSTLAWKIPRTEEPGRLQSMEFQRVGHDWATSLHFLNHTAPGFQLWFYFYHWIWVVHWGLFLRLPWRTWVCPCEGQVWRLCNCLSHRGSGSTRYSGELSARAAGNIVL